MALIDDDPFLMNLSTQKNRARTLLLIPLFVKLRKKKRNNSFLDGLEIEEIHHHPENLQCVCCQPQMTESGSTIVRGEAKFAPGADDI